MSVVLDTSFLVAAYDADQENHAEARSALDLQRRPLLPEYVFDEAVTLVLGRKGHDAAVQFGSWLLASDAVFIPSDDSLFSAAWTLFTHSQKLSFTDCVIAVLSKRHHASIATLDGDFQSVPGILVLPLD